MRGIRHRIMRRTRKGAGVGGLLLGLGLLAACGGTPVAVTNTVATTAPTTATAAAGGVTRTTTAVAAPATTTRATAPVATTTRTTVPAPGGAATATRASSPAAATPATATRPSSPVAGTTATRATASPVTPISNVTVPPAQALHNLRSRDNYRGNWVFSGFNIAGLTGDLRPLYEYAGPNRHVIVNVGGSRATEAFIVGSRVYAPNPVPVGGGFVEVDAANPLATPVQALFAVPDTILTNLIPDTAPYVAAGTAEFNGRPVSRYAGDIPLADLGFVDPSLAGRRGTAATTVFVDPAQGLLVGLEATIRTEPGGTDATAQVSYRVTDVGQVGPLAPPR